MPLEASHIGYRYPSGPWLFRGVKLLVRPGEVVGLIGPSGCGKTTLGRILAGYTSPMEGSVAIGGQALPRKGYQPVQMVFQHPERAVNPCWRIKQIIAEGGERDAELLQALGIEQRWMNRWPNELSGGELQRVCIARALGPSARFVIADEMTAMLDAITQAQIWQAVLHTIKQENKGMLVISHDMPLVRTLCDNVLSFDEISEGLMFDFR